MRRWLLALVIAVIPALASAQSWEATDKGYVLRRGKEHVRFDRGKWSAGIEGGPEVGWQMFLWHDRWVYETLPGGRVEAGPVLDREGNLTMTGTFSAREGSAPVKYAYRIAPHPTDSNEQSSA
jgi:hypothetical protein